MRYAIISDIHSNLEALNRVLLEIEKRKIDKIMCLGDLVGYGPNPNECIEIVGEIADKVIAGNHDYGCLYEEELQYFNSAAREVCEWTGRILTVRSKKYLQGLDLKERESDFLMVHSSPGVPKEWIYITSVSVAVMEFNNFDEKICFVGHTHIPVTFTERGGKYGVIEASMFEIKPNMRYIINVGSVGQPRDGDKRASFCIYDTATRIIEIIRVAYEIESVQRKMRDIGLPDFLIERLALGI
jgi:diadenosine tetraphosphatase ApaH/serine/threonine PP2A family protein phosphatase